MAMFHDVLDHLAHGRRYGGLAARLLEAWTPVPPLELLSDVPYGRHPRQRLDLYLPQHPSAQRRLVVFLYGGCWNTGARGSYRFLALVLATRGFAVAIPDYRSSPTRYFQTSSWTRRPPSVGCTGTRPTTAWTAVAWR
jgi:acetyl esterase/lipase